MAAGDAGDAETAPQAPQAVLRSRRYMALLLLAALAGVPVSAAAFGFLAMVDALGRVLYTDLPKALGFAGTPLWWPLPLLAAGGALAGLSVRYLPGRGGHEPTGGLALGGGPPEPVELPGILCAAAATLVFGAVLGPEAPLLAFGSGLAAGAVRLLGRDLPREAYPVMGAAGAFAAISALLGSPLLGAFLLLEAARLGGPMLQVVLLPGLLSAGIGSLIFTGLGSWTGLGALSLTLRNVPGASSPTIVEFGWALAIGVLAAALAAGIRRLARWLKARVEPRRVTGTVVMGLVVAGLAIAYTAATGKASSEVLYSGQFALDSLLTHSAAYSAGTLALLVVCKGLAYSASLSAFRGGPVFPAMFLGAAGGILLSGLPGLSLVAGFAMGIGAMSSAMLRLPMTSVLLATLLLGKEGLTVMPLVIVAVVVAFVASSRLSPEPVHNR